MLLRQGTLVERGVPPCRYVSFHDAVYANGYGEDIEEAFNLTADPWEMRNLASTTTPHTHHHHRHNHHNHPGPAA